MEKVIIRRNISSIIQYEISIIINLIYQKLGSLGPVHQEVKLPVRYRYDATWLV